MKGKLQAGDSVQTKFYITHSERALPALNQRNSQIQGAFELTEQLTLADPTCSNLPCVSPAKREASCCFLRSAKISIFFSNARDFSSENWEGTVNFIPPRFIFNKQRRSCVQQYGAFLIPFHSLFICVHLKIQEIIYRRGSKKAQSHMCIQNKCKSNVTIKMTGFISNNL